MSFVILAEQTLSTLRKSYVHRREWDALEQEWKDICTKMTDWSRKNNLSEITALINGYGIKRVYGLVSRLDGLNKQVKVQGDKQIAFLISHTLASIWNSAKKQGFESEPEFIQLFGEVSGINLRERLVKYLELSPLEQHFTLAFTAFFVEDMRDSLTNVDDLPDICRPTVVAIEQFAEHASRTLAKENLRIRSAAEDVANSITVVLTAMTVLFRQISYDAPEIFLPFYNKIAEQGITFDPNFVYFGDISIPTIDTNSLDDIPVEEDPDVEGEVVVGE